jgi:hypothetical protein
MTEIVYRGVTYTDARLTFRFDKERGEYRASLDAYYHGAGWPKDLAVRRLSNFLKEAHPDVWYGAKDIFEGYFQAKSKQAAE